MPVPVGCPGMSLQVKQPRWNEMMRTSGYAPAGEPGRFGRRLRDWAAAVRREVWRHKVASGLIAAGLVLAVAAAAIGAPRHVRATAPRVPGFTLPVLGHPGEHVSLTASPGPPPGGHFFAPRGIPCTRE